MRNYTNFYCNYCGEIKGLKTDHSKCSKELQKLATDQSKPYKHNKYKSNKRITQFLKSIGAD